MIGYTLSEATFVTIDVYDLVGRKVTSLVNNQHIAGYHQVIWNSNETSSGVYFCVIRAGENTSIRKMILLK